MKGRKISDMKLSFCEMKIEDVACVAAIEAECFSMPWSENAFGATVADSNYIFYVAKDDNRIIGMAGLIVSFDEADVTNVAITKEYRKKGIANAMLTELFKFANEKGVSSFTLEVRKSNEPAIRLYEQLGFVCEGVRPGFYDNPKEDALIYWKRG